MRKIFILFFSVSVFQYVQAQAPLALNYQAIARTADGIIIPTQNINVRFSVLDGSINGTELYSETHQTITNSYGLFTLAIGRGTPVTGPFSAINWASGTDKFLKVEIAPSGGTNYQLQGTTQLLSVPYALYSEKTRLIAGNAINITNGNTIAANYQAGAGININGNVISSTSSTLWVPDANGIHNQSGNVGIGIASDPSIPLNIFRPNTGNGQAALQLLSNDTWHTGLSMRNGNEPNRYTFVVAGPNNTESRPNNFGLFNHHIPAWAMIVEGNTNNLGIGYNTIFSTPPKSKLHIFNGDINIEQIGSGIILKSPNGQCWRVTIDNTGNLVRTSIACP